MYIRTNVGVTPNPQLREMFGTVPWTERLKRFVPPGALPPGVAAMVDDDRNILMIDKEIYDGTNERIQRRLWRLTAGSLDYNGKEIIF